MSKLTLDMNTFKALASDTRLDILRALDGKKMSLNDICKETKLNKATLHEHLTKLNEAGLIKKNEREGHKWVYYKLTWKGEGLLHPENTRIVVMFSTTFISLLIAVILIVNFLQPIPVGIAETMGDTTYLYEVENEGIPLFERSYNFNYIGEIDAKGKNVGNITIELQQNANIKNSLGENYADEEIAWRHAGTTATASFDGYGGADDADVLLCEYGKGSDASVPNGNVETLTFSWDSEPIKADQQILLSNVDLCQDSGSNDKVLLMGATRHIVTPLCRVTPYDELYPTSPFCKFFYINNLLEKLKIGDTIDYNEINECPEGFDEDDNETNETLYDNASFSRFEGEEKSLTGYYPAVPTIIATVQDSTLLYLAVICITFFGALFTLSTWRLWVNRKPKL
jgi:DNA-binding transcriptional ArsR family regulator